MLWKIGKFPWNLVHKQEKFGQAWVWFPNTTRYQDPQEREPPVVLWAHLSAQLLWCLLPLRGLEPELLLVICCLEGEWGSKTCRQKFFLPLLALPISPAPSPSVAWLQWSFHRIWEKRQVSPRAATPLFSTCGSKWIHRFKSPLFYHLLFYLLLLPRVYSTQIPILSDKMEQAVAPGVCASGRSEILSAS